MKYGMRFFLFIIVLLIPLNAFANFNPSSEARSYILMDYDTGSVLLGKNNKDPHPIASVTKVMTMLITMEAIQSGKISMDDMVVASEYACSMGGSQIYLEPGEQMTVEELLKSVAVGSANDASVVLAEHIMGSEAAFVEAMNQRAKGLGMTNTHFANCNGLDEDNHYSCAADVAIMSRELLKHNLIRPFLSIWMDSVRNGEFGLTNTNKLIRFYRGAIGTKTGSTTQAKYCLSAAAERNGMTLISVVLGAENSNARFEIAKELLNYGFSNYKVETYMEKGQPCGEADVAKGKKKTIKTESASSIKKLLNKNAENKMEVEVTLYNGIKAPIKKGDVVGKIELFNNGKVVERVSVVSSEDVKKLGLTDVYGLFLNKWFLK